MPLKSTMVLYELLDDAGVDGEKIISTFKQHGATHANWRRLEGKDGFTDLVEVIIEGKRGRRKGGDAPTLNIAGSLGGVGGRPAVTGIVSDADGALVALATALKLLVMQSRGDGIHGDVIVRTTICPNAPTMPHHPVPFMDSYVEFGKLKREIIADEADALVVVETSRGNRIINHNGFAVTPTIKEGWILKISEDICNVAERVMGRMPVYVPLSMQDITPFDNGLHHLNGLGELPAGCVAPAIGVAITSEIPVSGAASGSSCIVDLEPAVRFCVEVAKEYTAGNLAFYDKEEFERIVKRYGRMNHLHTMGNDG